MISKTPDLLTGYLVLAFAGATEWKCCNARPDPDTADTQRLRNKPPHTPSHLAAVMGWREAFLFLVEREAGQ